MADAYELVYLPGFIEDLQQLVAEAKRAPQGPEDRTLRVTMAALQDLRSGLERGTHRLGYMSSYPDLSDCETTYIGIDPNRKPQPPPGLARAPAGRARRTAQAADHQPRTAKRGRCVRRGRPAPRPPYWRPAGRPADRCATRRR